MKIGLMLPLGEDEAGGFAGLRAMALAAEADGLDSVWGADHLIFRQDGQTHGIHESWTVLTAVAAETSRVELGPMVLALPFRNPALTAKMAAQNAAVQLSPTLGLKFFQVVSPASLSVQINSSVHCGVRATSARFFSHV